MRAHAVPRPAVLLALAFVLPVLAGCIGGDDDEEPATTSFPVVPAALSGQPFATFFCKDGYRLTSDIADGTVDRCNHRVTKPLLDSTLFDVVNQHGPANEVSISINPTNPLNAAAGAKDYSVSFVSDHAGCGEYTVWMGTYHTEDGGLTWSNDLMPGFPGDPRDSSLAGNDCNTDPVLVYDDDGTLWYGGLNYRGAREDTTTTDSPGASDDAYSGSQLYFARSDDGGASYPFISYASFGDNQAIFNDKQWFAAQPGGDHMIVTWSNFVSAPVIGFPGPLIMYSESLDAGATWGPPTQMPPGTTAVNSFVQGSMPQYLPGGNSLAAIWRSTTGDPQGIAATTPAAPTSGLSSVVAYTEAIVTPRGAVFEPPAAAFAYNPVKSGPNRDGSGPSTFRWGSGPVLAVDTSGGAHDGRRYVVWEDQPGPLDSNVDVLLRYSDDGASWSAPIQVSDNLTNDQFLPWIDVDPEGGVHIAFYDRRNDPENRLLDVYYAYSDTGGESFYPTVRVTETNFDGDLGIHQNGSPFIGDYIGLDASPELVYITWSDTRHSGMPGREVGSDVYTATLLRDHDDSIRSRLDPVYENMERA